MRSVVFNASEVDDILQDVAVIAIQNADRYDGTRPVNAWVIGIARNRVMKYFEKQNRQKLCFSTELVDALTDAAASDATQSESLDSLQGCLDKLDSEKRKLLIRRHTPGVTARQLAEEIGYTDTRISRLLNRLYAALMKCIETQMIQA